MKVTAWRMFKAIYEAQAFNGEGARLVGGRWNSKGTAVVYTAGTAALAVLEQLVHVQSHEFLDAYRLCKISFDDVLVETVSQADLPPAWKTSKDLKRLGDEWAAKQSSAVLRVPSVIVDSEVNYLLNPAHPDFPRIDIDRPQPFWFDPRLRR